jgi:hypothetical protein
MCSSELLVGSFYPSELSLCSGLLGGIAGGAEQLPLAIMDWVLPSCRECLHPKWLKIKFSGARPRKRTAGITQQLVLFANFRMLPSDGEQGTEKMRRRRRGSRKSRIFIDFH